jgi:hypothetical protein
MISYAQRILSARITSSVNASSSQADSDHIKQLLLKKGKFDIVWINSFLAQQNSQNVPFPLRGKTGVNAKLGSAN